MKTMEQIREELARTKNDERLKGGPASVFANTILALIQTDLAARIDVLEWVLEDNDTGTQRDAQLRNEAEAVGVSEANMHLCGNCGVPRFVHGVILEACPNCGDDETDLSLPVEIP